MKILDPPLLVRHTRVKAALCAEAESTVRVVVSRFVYTREEVHVGESLNLQHPILQAPVPLEILPAGQYEPVYRLPLDVQSGELPVLPLSITGAIR